MSNTHSARKEREAKARRNMADLANSTLLWSAGVTIILALVATSAALPANHHIPIAAMGAVGGVALFSAVIGMLARGKDLKIRALVWSAAIGAIILILACTVTAQLILPTH